MGPEQVLLLWGRVDLRVLESHPSAGLKYFIVLYVHYVNFLMFLLNFKFFLAYIVLILNIFLRKKFISVPLFSLK